MDICVYGAGAIGGLLAGHLKIAGKHKISIVARGANLAAIRDKGLEMVMPEKTYRIHFDAAEESGAALPPQDIVFVTLKAHSVPPVAEDLHKLLKPDGFAVFISNGIPWWWNLGLAGGFDEPMRVDPEGRLTREIGAERTVGCVVFSGNELRAPGQVVHIANNQWSLGELDGSISDRLKLCCEMLTEAGLNGEAVPDLRGLIWKKLLRNTVFNTLSALTRLVVMHYPEVPPLVALSQQLTDEVVAVATACGWPLPPSRALDVIESGGVIAAQGGGAVKVTAAKSSMHQDVLAGRTMEVEPIVGHIQQIARHFNVPTPALDTMYAILRGLDHGMAMQGR